MTKKKTKSTKAEAAKQPLKASTKIDMTKTNEAKSVAKNGHTTVARRKASEIKEEKEKKTTPLSVLINGIRGFCMALADSVPGVSGGSIAFILGFYDDFIGSLDGLAFGDKSKKKKALKFLIQLGIGWIIGMAIAVKILADQFKSNIYSISSLFIGFIAFSIILMIGEEKASLKGKYKNIIFLILGIILVAVITYFNAKTTGNSAMNIANLNFGLGIYIFVVAMLAICAMVLPGISGSTILLIFGLYMPIISAVKNVMSLHFAELPAVTIFIAGVICGILSIVRAISNALKKHRSAMIYFILGMMVGSLYAIVMGPATMGKGQAALSLSNFSWLFFIIGGLIVLGLEKLKNIIASK